MALAVRCDWLLLGMLAAGCSNSVELGPVSGLDSKTPNSGGAAVNQASGGGTVGGDETDACSVATSWQARDLRFDVTETTGDFAEAVNSLMQVQSAPAMSVNSHMAPHCVWMVAFSATDGATTDVEHSAAYTEMFRHPAGLWTAAPQATGWMRVIDADSNTVWIPIANVTGSATFGSSDCSSIATGEASAVIPPSAAPLPITTSQGATTVGALFGQKNSKEGWQVRFTFSASLTR
jgi:hypothetical protein